MSARITFKALKAPEKQIATAVLIAEVTAEAYDWGNRMVLRLRRNYNSVPPSTYKRTHILHDSWRWHFSKAGGNLSVVVVNDATNKWGRQYATFVQGRRRRLFHRARGWKTAEEISKELEHARPFHTVVAAIFKKHVGV